MTFNSFSYQIEELDECGKICCSPTHDIKVITEYYSKIFNKMRLSNECCLLSLIFVEKLIVLILIFNFI